VVELADTPDLGSGAFGLSVQVPSKKKKNTYTTTNIFYDSALNRISLRILIVFRRLLLVSSLGIKPFF
jgi:hypothetical protein